MSEEFESVFRRKELHDMYSDGEVKSLDDVYLIEDTALAVQELIQKLDFYKGYKKKRVQDIADEMKVIQNKIEFFKSIIIATLKENKQKSVKFPGSCTVSSRNQKPKWQIDDEEEFITVLQEAQKAGEDVDDVLEVVTQYNVKKTPAAKLLAIWESSGKLEGFLKKARDGADVVSKTLAKTTVALSFVDKEEDDEEIEEMVIPVKAGAAPSKTEEYDTL
jgi:hypothetical protein